MATTERETRAERIARERREMNVKPWQFCPSAVTLGDNPWQADPSTAGFTSWRIAQEQRRKIHANNPSYFWDDCADFDEQPTKGK